MIDWDTLVTGPCMGVFGEAVTFTAPGRLPQAVIGVFDESYLAVMPLGDLGNDIGIPSHISEKQPVLGVQWAQFHGTLGPAQGDALAIRGTLYIIREVKPDGHGWALLLLNLAD